MEAHGVYNKAIASDTATVVNVAGARRVIITSASGSDPVYFDFSGASITDADMQAQLNAKVTASADTCTAGVIRAGQTIEIGASNYPTFNKFAFTCLDGAAESGNVDIVWY
jgi:hypothetical protein